MFEDEEDFYIGSCCEDKSDEPNEHERECIECGEMGYPIEEDPSKPFMCSSCKRLWA